MDPALPLDATSQARETAYQDVLGRISALLDGETDPISAMATVVCELHHAFEAYHWTGFYRVIAPELLAVGPYQGGHGCLRIDFERGVCGAAARQKRTIRLGDVHQFPGHIACSSSTLSEIAVPIVDASGQVVAILDVDSDLANAFDELDQRHLEALCQSLSPLFSAH